MEAQKIWTGPSSITGKVWSFWSRKCTKSAFDHYTIETGWSVTKDIKLPSPFYRGRGTSPTFLLKSQTPVLPSIGSKCQKIRGVDLPEFTSHLIRGYTNQ